MSVQWDGDQWLAQQAKQLGDNMEKAAIHFQNALKQKLNVTGRPFLAGKGKGRYYHNEEPSQPGEPPRKMLGDLVRSIAYEMAPDRQSALVGTNLDYGFFLEFGTKDMAPRPYFRPTMLEERDTVAKIISGNGK